MAPAGEALAGVIRNGDALYPHCQGLGFSVRGVEAGIAGYQFRHPLQALFMEGHGGDDISPTLRYHARRYRLRIQFPSQFPHQHRHHFLRISLRRATRLRLLRGLFTCHSRVAMLLHGSTFSFHLLNDCAKSVVQGRNAEYTTKRDSTVGGDDHTLVMSTLESTFSR